MLEPSRSWKFRALSTSLPDATMRRWVAGTSSLEYTMKVWQLVTHAATSPTYRRMKSVVDPDDAPGMFQDSRAVDQGWRRSVECAEALNATALLFQSPASFGPVRENVRRMHSFFHRIHRPRARLLWEPRGADWVAHRSLARSLCSELDLVHVVDPFVTPPMRGDAVYWRLHGPGGARHAYDNAALMRLHDMLDAVDPPGHAYVMFNNLPRVDDARRFARIVEQRAGANASPLPG